MNEVTNENYGETYNNGGENIVENTPVSANNGVATTNIENAFSDLISEYFESDNDNTTAPAATEAHTTTLDWDSVNNGQLYTNLAEGVTPVSSDITSETVTETTNEASQTAQTEPSLLYTNLNTIGTTSEEPISQTTQIPVSDVTQANTSSSVYNDIDGIYNGATVENTDTTLNTITGNTENTYNASTVVNEVTTSRATTVGGINAGTTEFKLTQANLPAKIGFWTKVRNFFMSDSKFQYSVQEQPTNTGLWNKVQNFFSFGKNK